MVKEGGSQFWTLIKGDYLKQGMGFKNTEALLCFVIKGEMEVCILLDMQDQRVSTQTLEND